MTALTIRQIPIPVERAIREKAEREHVSLNKAVIRLLEKAVGERGETGSKRHHDLDWMCGSWGESQVEDFEKHLAGTRKIDRELWP